MAAVAGLSWSPRPARPGRHDDVRRRRADPCRTGHRGAARPGRLRRLGHVGRGRGRAPGARGPAAGRGRLRTPARRPGAEPPRPHRPVRPRRPAEGHRAARRLQPVQRAVRRAGRAARVFGPQKGATPARRSRSCRPAWRTGRVLTRDLGVIGTDLRHGPGTGASGGLGSGLAAVGGRLLPRFDVLLDHLDLDARLARADLVLTAEGALDHQTPRGKVPAEVARRAKLYGRPVLALAGTLGEGAHEVPGVDAFHGIMPAPMALADALLRAAELLTDATERALRMILLGSRLPGQAAVPAAAVPTADVSGTQRRPRSGRFHRAPSFTSSLDGVHEPLDVLVRGARAEAHADGVEDFSPGAASGAPHSPCACGSLPSRVAHQRVGAEQAVAHPDAVLGGERGGEVRAVPALDDEWRARRRGGVVAEEGGDPLPGAPRRARPAPCRSVGTPRGRPACRTRPP